MEIKTKQPLLSDHVDMRLVAVDADDVTADRNAIVQLDPDHPGFRDREYRKRRNQIAQLAMNFQPGDQIPDAPYTAEEHQVWRAIWKALGPAHQKHACAEYLASLRRLNFDSERIPQLREVAWHDPSSKVRRVAVHSVTCQQCKPSPLSGDLVGLLVQVAQSDPNRQVREKAIGGLISQPRDARAVAALEQILRTETHPEVRRAAHHALKSQSPSYKARVDLEAREGGMEAGRDRREQRRLRHALQES